MPNKPKISFVIPLYNESESIDPLIERLENMLMNVTFSHEIVLIDDGSTDETTTKLEQLALNNQKYHCIFLSRNFGHQNALSAGLELCKGEHIMILDGDLQDPPELLDKFMAKIEEGYDVVFGIREKRKEFFLKRFFYGLFYVLLDKISDYPIPRDSGDFALVTRRALNEMIKMQEESRFLRGIRSWVGFKQIGLKYERDVRVAGTPKYGIKKLFKLAYNGIFNFSNFPIKLLSLLGVLCILISIIYFFITLLRKLIFEDVPLGFTALLFMIILFGGVQLLSIGIIGEYVQRIFSQVKNRPLYIIEKRIESGKYVSK